MTTDCEHCPLRRIGIFAEASKQDLSFISRFKTGELVAQPGTDILSEGAASAQLYTVLNGMGLRYKLLEDGRRQVVGFVMPGDFIGLQSGVMGVMRHSVEASTQMKLCVFNRADLWSLFKAQPTLAFDLTHIAATEEHLLGEALAAVGQLDAKSKVAWALDRFYHRLASLGLDQNGRVPLPYRQQDLADALGLSLVHTNKTLAKLRSAGIATWADDGLVVHKPGDLSRLAGHPDGPRVHRPII